MLLEQLDRDDRLRLLGFICSFAWADLGVQPEERELVIGLIDRLQLVESERAQVREWLEVPPREADPTEVPVEHRQLIRQAVQETIEADGKVTPEEREALGLFDLLVGDG